MDQTMLKDTLENYLAIKRRCDFLDTFIPQMARKLEAMKEDARLSLGAAPALSGMPGAGQPGDPTARVAAGCADADLNAPMRDCRRRLEGLIREKAELTARLALADCMLAGLSDEERFLITLRVMEKYTWKEIPDRYRERYGVWLAPASLRKRLHRGEKALFAPDPPEGGPQGGFHPPLREPPGSFACRSFVPPDGEAVR